MISGHSDVLMGALVTADPDTFAALLKVRHDSGAVPGPMETYLALRGLRTLPLRVAQAQASAQVLASRLAGHRAVRRVRYPGLPDDPGHERARRTMSGFGSLISIELADAPTADAMVEACQLWVFATSLGGVESTLERRRRWPDELSIVPEGLVRLSVGIEHVEDLWADLGQALDSLPGAPSKSNAVCFSRCAPEASGVQRENRDAASETARGGPRDRRGRVSSARVWPSGTSGR